MKRILIEETEKVVRMFLRIYRVLAVLAVLFVGYGISAQSVFAWSDIAEWDKDMDKGGNMDIFEAWVKETNRNNQLAVIKGKCWSACALKLSVTHVCIYPDATIHFHGIHYKGWDTVLPEDNEIMIASFPLNIQRWVRKHKALDSVKEHKVLTGHAAIMLGVSDCNDILVQK